MLGYNLGLLPNPTQRLPGWKMGLPPLSKRARKATVF
jgi:hypothetical protein